MTGRRRWKRCAAARPDVILLDIGLPGMDGFQVAQRVRADPDNSAIVIVAVSGYGQEEHRSRSTQAGCDHHLVKPIEPAVVSELLASLHSSRHGAVAGKHRAPAQERRLARLSSADGVVPPTCLAPRAIIDSCSAIDIIE